MGFRSGLGPIAGQGTTAPHLWLASAPAPGWPGLWLPWLPTPQGEYPSTSSSSLRGPSPSSGLSDPFLSDPLSCHCHQRLRRFPTPHRYRCARATRCSHPAEALAPPSSRNRSGAFSQIRAVSKLIPPSVWAAIRSRSRPAVDASVAPCTSEGTMT